MEEFQLNIPTKSYFGNGQLRNVGKEAAKYGSSVMIVYSALKAKRSILYSDMLRELEKYSITYSEFSCNDKTEELSTVKEGVRALKASDPSMIIALGDGALLATAQAVSSGIISSHGTGYPSRGMETVTRAVPVAAVFNGVPRGSEFSGESVVYDTAAVRSVQIQSQQLKPKFFIMDTAYAGEYRKTDIMSALTELFGHLLVSYFSAQPLSITETHILESLIRSVKGIALRLKSDYHDSTALGELMTISLYNGLGFPGGKRDDEKTAVLMAREIFLRHKTSMGPCMSAVYPAWMAYLSSDENLWRFRRLGQLLWDSEERKKIMFDI